MGKKLKNKRRRERENARARESTERRCEGEEECERGMNQTRESKKIGGERM